MAEFPLIPPPPGVTSNFDNPPSRGTAIIVVNAVFTALVVVVVAIRLWSRLPISSRKFGWDDVTCVLATFGSIARAGLQFNAVDYGYGRHMWDISLFGDLLPNIKKLIAFDLVYCITMYLTKLSLLLLYYRLFGVQPAARRLIHFGVFFCTLYVIPYLIISAYRTAYCITLLSSFTIPLCKTHGVFSTNVAFGVLNVVSDFYILSISIGCVSKLQINKKKKYALLIPFSAGFIACAMSVVRLGVVISNQYTRDSLYSAAMTSILSGVEVNLGIISGCMIFIPGVYKSSMAVASKTYGHLLSKYKSSRRSSETDNSHSGSSKLGTGYGDKTTNFNVSHTPVTYQASGSERTLPKAQTIEQRV